MIISDINYPQYSSLRQKVSNGKWRFRTHGTAIIYCGKGSPFPNSFETVSD